MVRGPPRLSLPGFSREYDYLRCRLVRRLAVLSDFTCATSFNRRFRTTAAVSLLGHQLACGGRAGMLTGFTSRAPLGFRLVPD